MNIGIYFTDEEAAYIKTQPAGFVRRLVQNDMAVVSVVSVVPIKPIKTKDEVVKEVLSGKGDGFNSCKKCGSQLPFFKGKCKYCKGG